MRRRDAFTLVELLTVIAVIAILAAITFGISAGVYQRQARTKAQAELSALASALESYRAQHGMYPPTDNAEKFLQALANRLTWKSDGSEGLEEESHDPRRGFVDPSKFDVAGLTDSNDFGESGQTFVDPWGRNYYYEYSTDDSWNRFGFILFSLGPDGKVEDPINGIIDKEAENNPDNIYLDN